MQMHTERAFEMFLKMELTMLTSQTRLADATSMPSASLRHRFAAQTLDMTICVLLFWCIGIALARRHGGIGISAEGLEIEGKPALLGAAVFATGTFLYFFLFEAIAGATVGKLLCRLTVQTEGHPKCGIASALVRNVLRPIDTVVGLILKATSAKRRTLGDRVAGTTVVTLVRDQYVDESQRCLPGHGQAAGWEARTKAAVIDLTLLGLLVVAYLFATSSDFIGGHLRVNVRGFSLLVLLDLLFFYFVAFDAILGGTVGKLVSKLRVVSLDGKPCGFAGATMRAVCRPIDACTAGILSCLLVRYTRTRQHLGDRLAGTVVVDFEGGAHAGLWAAAGVLSVIGAFGAYPFLHQTAARWWPQLVH